MRAPRFRPRGFTLIELLVALAAMALLAALSWRGLDGMIRVQASTHTRMDGVVTLQTGLTQWTADLDAVVETTLVSAVDYDGRVLRLTRRDTSLVDAPLRVIGWSRRVVVAGNDSRSSWVRWQSLPVRSRAELQDAWRRAEVWGQNPSDEEIRREVAIVGLDDWQVFYYRNDAWTNPQSNATSSAASGTAAGAAAAAAVAPMPDGVRLVLVLSAGQPLTGTVTRDWIRPVLGGGKS